MEIVFKDITKKYGTKYAVNNVNLTLTNGVYALLGANGSGKTTLIRMLASVLCPTKGGIFLDGQDIRQLDASYRNIIGYLPQNFGYYKDFTAIDFLLYIGALKGLSSKEAKEKSEELLKNLDLYEERNIKIRAFSGGMRQRLGIAQALLNDPEILILDEPTAGLDPKERINFRNFMSEMSKEKVIIYATHIVSDISYISDRVIIMKEGSIITDSRPDELIGAMESKVWSVNVSREKLKALQNSYMVGGIMPQKDDLFSARIVSNTKPFENAIKETPQLEDVYLYYFGEESRHEYIN